MEPALKAMLTQTVGHSPYLGQDAYGKPSYGPVVQRPARIQYRVTTLVNAQGQERTSTTTLITDGDFHIDVRDKVTLPDGTAPAIQRVYSPTEPETSSIHHHEITL